MKSHPQDKSCEFKHKRICEQDLKLNLMSNEMRSQAKFTCVSPGDSYDQNLNEIKQLIGSVQSVPDLGQQIFCDMQVSVTKIFARRYNKCYMYVKNSFV